MGIYAKDNLTRYAYQSRTPETKSYSYDWFAVIQFDSEVGEETKLFGSVDWEEARQKYAENLESIDSYNQERFEGFPVIQLRIEGIVYN